MADWKENNCNTLLNINLTIIWLSIVFYILYVWASFIIPFVISSLIAFAIMSTYWFIKKYIKSPFVSIIISILLYALFFWWIYKIITTNIENISEKASFYQEQFRVIIDKIVANFWIKEWELYDEIWQYLDFPSLISNMTSMVTSILGYTWIIILYLIFILLEYKYFSEKLSFVIKDQQKKGKWLDIINEVKRDTRIYFWIKIFVSLLAWLFAYIFMKILWLDFALFWAFLVFLFNFIPNFGSIISTIFPLMLSLIQYDDYYHFFIVLVWFVCIHTLVWNFIEPILTWNKLNLSPLVNLIALVFWWTIWGIPGMFLSVPIMFITSIIFSKSEQTKFISILLSEKWNTRDFVWPDILKKRNSFTSKIFTLIHLKK